MSKNDAIFIEALLVGIQFWLIRIFCILEKLI